MRHIGLRVLATGLVWALAAGSWAGSEEKDKNKKDGNERAAMAVVNTTPDLAAEWIKNNSARGLPAKALLDQYMAAVRARGATPERQWGN